MADPNHVALWRQKLVFMLPCKVGNTSIKAALADATGRDRGRLHCARAWDYMGNYRIADLPPDWLIVGFKRHPFARFLSAYRHKIRDEGRFGLVGFDRMPDLDEVAEALPRITDQHWRSLTDDLTHEGRLLPGLVAEATGWERVRKAVTTHCGLPLGSLPHLNGTRLGGVLSDRAERLIRAHYAEDFERFGYA